MVLAEAGKAPEGMPPGAAVGAVVQAVVTIEIINRVDMEVTIKGPLGNYLFIPVADKALIEGLHVGEVVIMTYGNGNGNGLGFQTASCTSRYARSALARPMRASLSLKSLQIQFASP